MEGRGRWGVENLRIEALRIELRIEIVVPLTTKIKNYNPVLKPTKANCLKSESEMLIFHIRSVSKDRLIEKSGDIESSELEGAIKTLNDILKY